MQSQVEPLHTNRIITNRPDSSLVNMNKKIYVNIRVFSLLIFMCILFQRKFGKIGKI
jgi:hypothetical protein